MSADLRSLIEDIKHMWKAFWCEHRLSTYDPYSNKHYCVDCRAQWKGQ